MYDEAQQNLVPESNSEGCEAPTGTTSVPRAKQAMPACSGATQLTARDHHATLDAVLKRVVGFTGQHCAWNNYIQSHIGKATTVHFSVVQQKDPP